MSISTCRFSLIFLLLSTALLGQTTRSTTLRYTPPAGANGYEISGINYKYQFRMCGGEVAILMTHSKSATIGNYHYEGQIYTPQQLGAAHKKDFFINIYDISADVYDGSYRLGSVTFTNVIGSFAGCFGETYPVIDMVGQDGKDKRWRDKLDDLQLSNVKITKMEAVHYKTQDAIKEILKKEELEDLKLRAQMAEGQGDYETAYDLYSDAQYKGEKEAMAAKAAEMKEKMKAQRQAERASGYADEAEDLAAEGDYQGAARKYKSAAQADPANADQYQQKAQEYQTEAQAQKEAEQAEEADSEGEEGAAEDEGSEDESSEEGGDGDSSTQREERGSDGDSEESSGSSSRSAYEEEYARQQRQAQYWEARNEAIDQNTMAAGQMGAAALMVHLFIGKLIYANMENDSPLNFMEGPGNMFSIQGGYGVSSVPIFTNSDFENFNGNSFSNSTETENFESFTLDLGFNMAYWPLYSPELALGMRVGGHLGHGILFQQYSMSGQLGLRGHIGGEKLQIFAAYDMGERSVWHSPWIDPGENGSGTAEFAFHRITAGPQFRMLKNNNRDWSTLRFLGILERNVGWTEQISSPATFSWSPGFRFEYNQRSRYSIGAEAVFNYRRVGEVDYGYASDATFNGTMFNLTFHRRFDIFPNSAIRLGSAALAFQGINRFNELTLQIGQPGLSWIEDRDTTRFASNSAFLGFDPIGVDYTFGLYKNLGLTVGSALSYNGVRIDPSGQTAPYQRVHRIGLNVPVSLRVSVPSAFLRYFAEAGYSYSYYPLNFWENRSRGYNQFWESPEEPIYETLRSGYGNYRLSIGAVIPGRNVNSYIGLTYQRSIGSIFAEGAEALQNQPSDILLHRLSISYSVSL